MRKKLILLVSLLIALAGCNYGDGNQVKRSQINNNNILKQGTAGMNEEELYQRANLNFSTNGQELGQISTIKENNTHFLPVIEVLQLLDFKVKEEENSIKAGVTDVFMELKLDESKVIVDEQEKNLTAPAIQQNNITYISIEDMQALLGTNASVDSKESTLSINIQTDATEFGFPEEPEDFEGLPTSESSDEDIPSVLSLSIANSIISDGKRYLGRPYVFGSPSGYTRTFDCSSFTQYIYYKNGIKLPRTARSQARLGKYIPVSKLRKGDLLFFHWPGRNVYVGHVGIYVGNGYMLHSSPVPKDGVQFTKVRTSRFMDVYLGAKRINRYSDLY